MGLQYHYPMCKGNNNLQNKSCHIWKLKLNISQLVLLQYYLTIEL